MRAFAAALSLVLVIAGCGDDGDGSQSGALVVRAMEFEFSPDVVTVSAGGDVVVEVRNLGALEHTWTVLRPEVRVETAQGLDPAQILSEIRVGAAEAGTLSFTAPAAGDYQVICMITGHLEAGMEATLRSQ